MPLFHLRYAVLAGLLLLAACARPADQGVATAPASAPPAATQPSVAAPVAQIPTDAPPEPVPGPRERLTIASGSGSHAFQVEIADTEAERAKGLMFRRKMGEDDGMLFDFMQARPVMFWMKNTYIPLDMVFIDGDGVIAAVASNTTPLSEAPVGPGVPVQAVLELNAGRAEALGIRPGDKVSHRIFKPR